MPKPDQWSAEYAQIFKDQSVVDDYHLRPAYVPETFNILEGLMLAARPRRVLDAGCGTGILARELAHVADLVDTVDFSAAAIERGQCLPGGGNPKLNWLCSSMETAGLARAMPPSQPDLACIGWIGTPFCQSSDVYSSPRRCWRWWKMSLSRHLGPARLVL